jgi:hypothetical protein
MPSKKDYSEDINSFFFNEQNKKKLDELKKKYGMIHSGENENASPELVNKFLDNVQKFEEAYEKGEYKKVIEVLKYPTFKKLDELTVKDISKEIIKVLDIYENNNINIDVIEKNDVSEEDFYKFLTEELPQHEMDYIDIEGLRTNFIYEDFHPSDKLDAKDTINFFIRALLDNDKENLELWVSKQKFHFNGNRTTLSEFTKSMRKLIPEKVIDSQIIFNEFKFGKQNMVKADFIFDFEELKSGISKQNQIALHLLFELKKCQFGGFEIVSCSLDLE